MNKIRLLLFLQINFLIFVQTNFSQQDFFLNDWEPKEIESPNYFTNVEKPSGIIDFVVTVDFGDTITKIPKYIYGNNANTYSTIMWDNAKVVNNLRNLNPHILRYPGGNLSNEYFWDRAPNNKPSDIPNDVNVWFGKNEENWTMSLDNYYRLLDSVNSTGIITVNYAYARYGTSANPVAQAAHYAAEWVRHDNGRTKFWEIGNENFGNWNKGYEIDQTLNKDGQPKFINGEIYGQQGLVFADSMKAAADEIGHEIFIGFQAFEEETSWDAIQTSWNEKMMAVVGEVPDFYIVHNYFTPYDQNSNASVILDSYTRTSNFKNQVLKDLTEFRLAPKPIALTEYNIFAVGSKQMISHINGMHSTLVLGEAIKQGYGLVNRWDLSNGFSEGNDHGMFSRGEPNVSDFTPYPAFYHMMYLQKYFGDVLVKSEVSKVNSNSKLDIVAFASNFSSNHAGITLINKSANNRIVELDLKNYEVGERIYWFQLQDENGDGTFSSKVFVNGESSSQVSGGPENYLEIAPYSFTTDDSLKIECPPYSAIYLLLEGETLVNVEKNIEEKIPNKFYLSQNYPNPFNPNTTIEYSIPSNLNFETSNVQLIIYDILGREIKYLVNQFQKPGNYKIQFDGTNLTSGVYFYVLKSGEFMETKKLIILK
ncbi:MAG: T9SS type A sorting domain-containing protein [Ignavibacteriae bacterium]|nr:T9SS type A sorting domain-containing protein [Ignavibacteriota bacterium]